MCGDREVMYYLNTGWTILASVPNFYPEPFIFWFIEKEVPTLFNAEMRQWYADKAREYIR
jgi:hypothetical protein